MFHDLCVFEKGPLLPSEFLKLSIEVEKYSTMRQGKYVITNSRVGIVLL